MKRIFFLLICSILLAVDGLAQAPHIVSVAPSQNELNVAASAGISVTFDIAMNEETISESSFLINARSTGPHPGIIMYDNNTNTVTLNPSTDFVAGETVSATLTTAIQSADGIPLEFSYAWSFTINVSDQSSGIYGSYSEYPVGEFARSVYPADFDSDGDIDLAISGDRTGDITVLLNNGDGVFTVDSTYWIGWSPLSIAVGDLDGDNDIDLAVSVEEGEYFGNVSILLNSGDGAFYLDGDYTTDGGGFSIVASDLDGDGDLDLATANMMFATSSVLFNNGQAVFDSCVNYSVGGWPTSITASDLENDGDPDLIIANSTTNDVSLLYNNGDGTFAAQYRYPVGSQPSTVISADLNGDGFNDLAVSNEGESIGILLNEGDGNTFTENHYEAGGDPNSIFAADLNGDAYLDLVVANTDSDSISVLFNDGNGVFPAYTEYPAGDGPFSAVAADLRGDGRLDLAVANIWSNNVSILFNDQRSGIPFAGENLPVGFRLRQNYPNPFNSSTEISFDLPRAGHISLAIYDITGRKLETLLDGIYESGSHGAVWDGMNSANESAATGIYFYALQYYSGKISKRMFLLK